MPRYRIRAQVTVTYEYDLEADAVEDAIAAIEDGECEDEAVERDSSGPVVTEHTIDGQMGWTQVEQPVYAHSPHACPSNHWNDGNDVCEDCGTNLNTLEEDDD